MIQHSEQRIEYSIARKGMTVSIEIVQQYMDRISPICGEIDHRWLTGVTVEGDVPYDLKSCIAHLLFKGDYIGAEEALDQYLLSVLATKAVQPLEPNGGNVYKPHPLMITSGEFWRCAHGNTGIGLSGTWIGCPDCVDPQAVQS